LEKKGFDPIVFRFFNLSSHYRSKLNFTWEALQGAKNSWEKLKGKFLDLGQQNGTPDEAFIEKFKTAINNDLSMPQALVVMWDVFKSNINDFDKRATLLEFDKVFGLGLGNVDEDEVEVPEEIKKLVAERDKARVNKNWEKSDELRKEIEKAGWLLEDTADTSRLRKKD